MPRPTDGWTTNPDAVSHVKNLLHKAGTPLEVRVAKESQRFATAHSTHGWHISTERLVYGDVQKEARLREIDQYVSLYKDIALGDAPGVQLNVEILIECKYRDGLVVFGYPEGRSANVLQLPAVAALVGSSLFASLDLTPSFLASELSIASLLIFKGDTPQGVHKENLIDNAGAALYDFVTYEFDVGGASLQGEVAVIKELGVLDQFQSAQATNRHLSPRAWLAEQPASLFKQFNTRAKLSQNVYFPVWPLIPIVCFNSPIYVVTTDSQGRISGFEQTKLLLTSVRAPGWHQRTTAPGATASAEGPVVVTDVRKLRWVLNQIAKWTRGLEAALLQTSTQARLRSVLEAALYEGSRARTSYDAYRSYLGFL